MIETTSDKRNDVHSEKNVGLKNHQHDILFKKTVDWIRIAKETTDAPTFYEQVIALFGRYL